MTRSSEALTALVVVSLVLLGLRIHAASVLGFGDSEALYACWAAHPQPAYLDHPGLVGIVARLIGHGVIPSPARVHIVTTIAATLVPWLAVAASMALGTGGERGAIAGLIIALVPETAVGLYALTPDLLLAPAWLGSLALAAIAMRAAPGTNRSAAAFLGAGLLAGIACAAKVSGALLVVALVTWYSTLGAGRAWRGREGQAAVRTIWPWMGVLAGLVVVVPIAIYEMKMGWPMLRHRLVDTQAGAGVALRNVGALFGGQLAYLSPVFAVLGVVAARDLVRERSRDAISRLLFLAFAIPFVPLLFLCLWSNVAEPHWIAPALLALPLHAARRVGAPLASRGTFLVGASIALVFTLGTHAWVLLPESSRLLPAGSDPKLDIANELYGWPAGLSGVRDQIGGAATPFDPAGHEVVVVGPHWTVCAQLHAGLPGVRVGCATPVEDDFDGWLPRDRWRRAEHVLFVTDNRFAGDGAGLLPEHVQRAQSRVRVLRGGRTARVFQLYLYERRATGSLPRDAHDAHDAPQQAEAFR